jgi:ABC-type glutathione transport system ATPase component
VNSASTPVLDTCLSVSYQKGKQVLSDVSLSFAHGEIVGLVGESGSGKSTLALALFNLLDRSRARVTGHIRLNGRDLLNLPEKQMRRVRGSEIALVLQSAGTALNPVLRIGAHLREAWLAHSSDASKWKQAAASLLERVCLPSDEEFFRRYPSQISVGQAQRLLIAMALLHRPSLLVADEPTSALDAITHAEILALIRELNRDLGLSVLLISHDLLSAASLCSRLAILRDGQIVESGAPYRIFAAPEKPYTQRLIAALPPHPLDTHSLRVDADANCYEMAPV